MVLLSYDTTTYFYLKKTLYYHMLLLPFNGSTKNGQQHEQKKTTKKVTTVFKALYENVLFRTTNPTKSLFAHSYFLYFVGKEETHMFGP